MYDDEDELFCLNNSLTLRIDTYYSSNYYLSDKSQGTYGPYHAVLQDEIYSSYEEAYMIAEELNEEFKVEFYPYLIEDGYIIAGGNFADKSSSQDLAEELNDEGYIAESMNGNLENIIASVSYTHLDVYKRQDLSWLYVVHRIGSCGQSLSLQCFYSPR